MKSSSVKHFVKSAWKSIVRNSTLSIASIVTVSLTLFLFSMLLLTLLNTNNIVKDVESKVELEIFLEDDATSEQKVNIDKILKEDIHIVSIEFIDKSKALEKFQEQLGEDNDALVQGFEEENPLPESYIIRVDDINSIELVAEEFNEVDGVKKIDDNIEIVSKISSFTSGIKWIGAGILIILIPVSIFLIMNTIRLAVFSRKKEIGIMKFVGATDVFIRWPFILEGMFIGFVGALVSVLFMNYAYVFVFNRFDNIIEGVNLINPNYVHFNLTILFLLSGTLIGVIGSVFSIRKFLKV
ncbi:permease-like cell division protein FtsX [Clostridium sp. DL1XJH146]